MSKNKKNKNQKILGGTKFANSKKKIKSKEKIKNKMMTDKNRSLKVKIKHLQKEEKRINDFIAKNNSTDKKSITQKAAIKLKIEKLLELQKKFIQH